MNAYEDIYNACIRAGWPHWAADEAGNSAHRDEDECDAEWRIVNAHLICDPDPHCQLRIDTQGPRFLAWYDRGGPPPIFVGHFDTVREAKAALLELARDVLRLRTTYFGD